MSAPVPTGVVKCKTCEGGTMTRKKVHRMSGPAVVVGYLMLIPSVLGAIFGLIMMLGTGAATTAAAGAGHESVKVSLRNAGVDEATIDAVLAGDNVDTSSMAPAIRAEVEMAQAQLTGAKAGAGIGAALGFGFAIFIMVGSFVGGLLGYLLTMKKKILQCVACEAVIQAS